MGDILYCGPPEPPVGQAWCVVCLLLAKGRQHQDPSLAGYLKSQRHDDYWVPWPGNVRLWPAEYRTVASIQGLGVADVCWHHAAGMVEGQASPLAVADGGLPPGLLRGRG